MSIEMRHLFSHLASFPENLGDLSEKQGERFRQALKTLKEIYWGY